MNNDDSSSFDLPSPYHRARHLTEEEKKDGYVIIDCYDILDLVGGLSSRRQHAAKKVLFGGGRGHKGEVKDLKEAAWTLQSEIKRLER